MNAVVDLRLTQVPWDQVMDVVLKSAQLTYELDGPVLRVLTREARGRELKDEAEQKKASEAAPALESVRLRLNYASAAALKKLLEQARMLSDARHGRRRRAHQHAHRQGLPQQPRRDPSSSSPISTGRSRRSRSKRRSCRPTATRRARSACSGASTAASRRSWATRPPRVPEPRHARRGRVVAQGPVTQGPNDPRATELEKTGTAVNLPVAGATSALGLSLGAINGAFGIDVALSALEHEGKVKILSHAARDDAEQQAGGGDAGLPDSDSDRREQHRHGAVQGCGAEARS